VNQILQLTKLKGGLQVESESIRRADLHRNVKVIMMEEETIIIIAKEKQKGIENEAGVEAGVAKKQVIHTIWK
jgi:hypothetical protein